ncbi:hypothetical protein KKE28_00975 [Patescibacteria group bacterium]|nr:hypothetical protein [Patescibacteria group bacterium]
MKTDGTTLNPNELAFVNFIRENGSVAIDQLVEWSHQTVRDVERFLRQLSARGFIQQIDGFWQVP